MAPRHPYRTHARRLEASSSDRWELALPFAVVWGICASRVLVVLVHGFSFDSADTLALGALLLLPLLVVARG
jgi:hypothetical protein